MYTGCHKYVPFDPAIETAETFLATFFSKNI